MTVTSMTPKSIFRKMPLRALCCAAVLQAAPVAAQEIELTPNQMGQLAVNAIAAGDAGTAVFAADALLSVEPNNPAALFVRTEAAILAEDWAAAVTFGKRTYWASEGGVPTFNAARLVARAYAELGQDTFAQLWLRRARQYSPNAQAARAVAEDYQFLRNRNPLSFNLRVGLTPSSNINNGSASETSDLFGLGLPFELSPDARALSGWEATVNASATYRLHTNRTSATFFDVSVNAQRHRLSNGAEAALAGYVRPDGTIVKASDFDSTQLTFGLTHRFVLNEGAQPTTASLDVTRQWSAGEFKTDVWDASVSHAWIISPSDRINLNVSQRFSTGGQTDLRPIDGDDPIHSTIVGGGWTHVLDDGGVISLGLTASDHRSADPDADYSSTRVALGYVFPEPLFGINLSTNVSYEDRTYENSIFDPNNGRSEQLTTIGLNATFSEIEVYGFQPVVNFGWTQQESNVDLFDREYTSVGFDLTSSF